MIVMVKHHVRDFDAWKQVFDEHDAVRRGHGSTGYTLYRSVDDPNSVTVLTRWPSTDAARRFADDPSLAEAMRSGGVDAEPEVAFLTEAGEESYAGQKAA